MGNYFIAFVLVLSASVSWGEIDSHEAGTIRTFTCTQITNQRNFPACASNSNSIPVPIGPPPYSPPSLPPPMAPPNVMPPVASPCDCFLLEEIELNGQRVPAGTPCPKERVACEVPSPEKQDGYCTRVSMAPAYSKAMECEGTNGNDCKVVERDVPVMGDSECYGRPKNACGTFSSTGYVNSDVGCSGCSRLAADFDSRPYEQVITDGMLHCKWVDRCSGMSTRVNVPVTTTCQWTDTSKPATPGRDGYEPPGDTCFHTPGPGPIQCQGSCNPRFLHAESNCTPYPILAECMDKNLAPQIPGAPPVAPPSFTIFTAPPPVQSVYIPPAVTAPPPPPAALYPPPMSIAPPPPPAYIPSVPVTPPPPPAYIPPVPVTPPPPPAYIPPVPVTPSPPPAAYAPPAPIAPPPPAAYVPPTAVVPAAPPAAVAPPVMSPTTVRY